MTDRDRIQEAVDRNYEAFCTLLPELLETHQGRFALLHHGEIVNFFDTLQKAVQHGETSFTDGLYSVQEVMDATTDLGWFSHVVD